MVFQPLSGLLAGVFWVTILLEDDITGGFAIIIQSPLKFIPQDVAVEIRIHDPINFASQASPFPSHAAPHHNRTTPKLPGPFHYPFTDSLPPPFPYPFLPI